MIQDKKEKGRYYTYLIFFLVFILKLLIFSDIYHQQVEEEIVVSCLFDIFYEFSRIFQLWILIKLWPILSLIASFPILFLKERFYIFIKKNYFSMFYISIFFIYSIKISIFIKKHVLPLQCLGPSPNGK